MLTTVLRILSILGILLLVLLLLAVVILLLVLFIPITYQVSGAKDEEGFGIKVKVRWLLGLVRLRYEYPKPGELVAKILFFTVYRMKIPSGEKEKGSGNAHTERTVSRTGTADNGPEKESCAAFGKDSVSEETASAEKKLSSEDVSVDEKNSSEEQVSGFGKILQKFEKIKYTIRGIYDKIKEIWNNISYYLELLQEEETRQLISHIRLRAGRIIKSVRPRHIRADILFGTGSPDTTGYLYGVYCMISPMLRESVCVTPDFDEAMLEADFTISGHITIWILAVNACKVALDKRLRRLIRKVVSPERKTEQKNAA